MRPWLTVQPDNNVKQRGPKLAVCCIGDRFLEGTKEAVMLAANTFAGMLGGEFVIVLTPSLTVLPPLGLGAMHNFMIQKALQQDADYIALIHNDVLVEPDTFSRLVQRDKQYIIPWFDQSPFRGDESPIILGDPMYGPDQGIIPINWSVPYLVVYNARMFDQIGQYRIFTEAAIYQEDEYNCTFLRCHGVKLFQDTNTKVKLLRGPAPLWQAFGELKLMKFGQMPGDP